MGLSTSPSWSPDSKQIVFEGVEENTSQWDIYKINIDGSNLTNLTRDSASDSVPVWSPDGTHIAFESQFGKDGDGLYIMAADGSSIELLYKIPSGLKLMGAWVWSPDSKAVALSVGYDISNPFGQILLVDLQQRGRFRLTPPDSPIINFQLSWQERSTDPAVFVATTQPILQTPESTLEQAIEPTLPLATLTASQQPSIKINFYFYVLGGIFTAIGTLVTIILMIWLARRRGYSSKFLTMGVLGLISVLVLVFASTVIRTSSRNLGVSLILFLLQYLHQHYYPHQQQIQPLLPRKLVQILLIMKLYRHLHLSKLLAKQKFHVKTIYIL